jgi:hypothetical protein
VARAAVHNFGVLVGCLALIALLLFPHAAAADTGTAELAAGVAARSSHPADLTAARAHFENAARGTDDGSAADALYYLAELDDSALRFDSAMSRYDAAVSRLPSGRFTPRAKSRAHELRTHSEGGFAPLVRLETVRRSPEFASDPAAIDALARDAASFPQGKVRVEARMLAVEAYLGRLHRAKDALPLLRLVADDPVADVVTARVAASDLVDAYVEAGDLALALDAAHGYPRLVDQDRETTIRRLMRRRPLRWVASGDLALLCTFALLAIARPGRAAALRGVRKIAPMALAFAAFACGVGGLLASSYEQTSPYPFTSMFPTVFVVILLARCSSANGSSAPIARTLRATVAFSGIFAAAFLLLDHMDPVYLQGFGL